LVYLFLNRITATAIAIIIAIVEAAKYISTGAWLAIGC
jgi:hypothetical protein